MPGRKTERYTPGALKALKVAELRVLAREHKLIGYSQLRKADLLARLQRHLATLDRAGDERTGRKAHGLVPDLAAALQAPVDASGSAPGEVPVEPKPVSAPVEDPGAMRDPSWYAPELPAAYGLDRLTLMVRDPHWLYCYWELRPALLSEARAAFAGPCWPVLRVHLLGEDDSVLDGWEYGVGPEALDWYVNTGRPGSRFRAELGLRDRAGAYRRLVASNTVCVPQDAPSQRWDEEWVGLSRETWERLERRERPWPGSLGGWDLYRMELAEVAADRLGASERLSAAAPGSGKGEGS